ncbi:MAG: hypothetical protein JWM41_2879 [Gemmatimonadetes bacterium]|nr:hypothetical protein [Gemmatimonadota bacterium]
MRNIVIEVNGEADVRVDGMLLLNGQVAGRPRVQDEPEDALRHDTPREVVIASACHEAIRQYEKSRGDHSLAPWSQCGGAAQASLIGDVRAIIAGSLKTPADLHEAWRAQQTDAGWVYGPVASAVTKTHPDLMPYAQLSADTRRKNVILFTLASALLSTE